MDVRQVARGIGLGLAFVALVAGAFLLAGGASLGRRSPTGGAGPAATAVATTSTSAAPATTAPATTTTLAPAETPTTATTEAPPAVASLTATLDGGDFTLNGIVPDEETATRLVEAASVAYGPDVATDLVVAPDVASPVWLAGAHQGITLIPMISEGTITAIGDEVELSGTSPNEQYLVAFEQAIGATFGVADIESNVEITNLLPPTFNARRTRSGITLSGVLPSTEIREIIVGGAQLAYGADAVTDTTVVGAGLYTSYWMYTMPGVFQLFAAFPDYEIDVTNGVTTGSLNDGANFATGSAELTPETQAILNIGVALLVRDQSLGIRVTGHTDSVGPADFNQRLSEARAQSAVEYMLAAGVDPARLVARGRGEEEPIASNDTDEGRASNRRVEFEFGPVQLIIGGS